MLYSKHEPGLLDLSENFIFFIIFFSFFLIFEFLQYLWSTPKKYWKKWLPGSIIIVQMISIRQFFPASFFKWLLSDLGVLVCLRNYKCLVQKMYSPDSKRHLEKKQFKTNRILSHIHVIPLMFLIFFFKKVKQWLHTFSKVSDDVSFLI